MSDTVNTITARRGHIQALAFAAKGGAALGSLLHSIAKRKEEESKGPLETALFLETTYSDEEGHNIPQVGSKEGETGNKPYDRYTVEVPTSDGKRKVPGSWFTDVVKSTQVWADLNQRREWCKQGQGEGVPADIIALSTSERAMEVKRIGDFIKNMRTGLTRGSMLLHQVEAVSNLNPARIKVKLPYRKNAATEEMEVIGSLIRVSDPSGIVEEDEVLTVSQFLAWDVEKAGKAEDKGSITSLKATANRAPKKKPGEGTATAPTIPSTMEQVKTLFNVLASALDNGTESGRKMEAQVLAACAKPGAEGDEAVLSIGTVCLALDNVWNVINNRYNTLKAAQAAAINVKPAKVG